MTVASENPKAPKENPKQKYLIVAFAVCAVLAVVALVLTRDDFDKTQKQFLKDWNKKQVQKILKLASPQILIGQLDSENSVTQTTAEVLPKLLKITENSLWSDDYKESDGGDSRLRVVMSVDGNGPSKFQFLFSKGDKDWKWSGFLMSNAEDYAALLSNSPPEDAKPNYQEIQSDPAKGDEPSLED